MVLADADLTVGRERLLLQFLFLHLVVDALDGDILRLHDDIALGGIGSGLEGVVTIVVFHLVGPSSSHLDGLGLDAHLTFLLELAVGLGREDVDLVADNVDTGSLVVADVTLAIDGGQADLLAGDGDRGACALLLELVALLHGILRLREAADLTVHL